MALPEAAEQELWQQMQEYEEVRQMPYVTSVERIGFRRGLIEGRLEGLEEGMKRGLEQGIEQGKMLGIQEGLRRGLYEGIAWSLEFRFGSEGLILLPAIYHIGDQEALSQIGKMLRSQDTTLEDLHRFVSEQTRQVMLRRPS